MSVLTDSTLTVALVPEIEPALPADAPEIAALLRRCSPETVMVPERQVRRHWSRYLVVRDETLGVIASAAVHDLGTGAAELRSVAVDPRRRGLGLGPRLVHRAMRRAACRGQRLLCVTLHPSFFARLGFRRIPMEEAPDRPGRPAFIAGRRRVAMVRRPDAVTLTAGATS